MDAKLNDDFSRVVALAESQAAAHGQDFVGTEHILLGLLQLDEDKGTGIATKVLESYGISVDMVRAQTERAIVPGRARNYGPLVRTRQADKALKFSQKVADRLGAHNVGSGHILLGLLKGRDGIAVQVLRGLGLSLDQAQAQVDEFTRGRRGQPGTRVVDTWTGPSPVAPVRRPGESAPLDHFGRNLTRQARAGELGPAVGRDQEITEVLRVLSASPAGRPLLIGDTSGCLTVLEGVAQRIAAGKVPPELAGKELYYHEPDRLVAESGINAADKINSAARVLAAILEETQAREGIILAVGQLPAMAAEPQLRLALAIGVRWIVGTVSPDYYRQDSTANADFYREFTPTHVVDRRTAYDLGKLKFELRAAAHG